MSRTVSPASSRVGRSRGGQRAGPSGNGPRQPHGKRAWPRQTCPAHGPCWMRWLCCQPRLASCWPRSPRFGGQALGWRLMRAGAAWVPRGIRAPGTGTRVRLTSGSARASRYPARRSTYRAGCAGASACLGAAARPVAAAVQDLPTVLGVLLLAEHGAGPLLGVPDDVHASHLRDDRDFLRCCPGLRLPASRRSRSFQFPACLSAFPGFPGQDQGRTIQLGTFAHGGYSVRKEYGG